MTLAYTDARMISKLQDEVLELMRLLEQSRRLVDALMNEPRLCDECKRREDGFQ